MAIMSKETIYKIIECVCTAFLTIAGVLLLSSCSVTRASVTSPRDSASTTITITTQNPVSADTKVDSSLPINFK